MCIINLEICQRWYYWFDIRILNSVSNNTYYKFNDGQPNELKKKKHFAIKFGNNFMIFVIEKRFKKFYSWDKYFWQDLISHHLLVYI